MFADATKPTQPLCTKSPLRRRRCPPRFGIICWIKLKCFECSMGESRWHVALRRLLPSEMIPRLMGSGSAMRRWRRLPEGRGKTFSSSIFNKSVRDKEERTWYCQLTLLSSALVFTSEPVIYAHSLTGITEYYYLFGNVKWKSCSWRRRLQNQSSLPPVAVCRQSTSETSL